MSNDNMWEDEENFSDAPEEAQTASNGRPPVPTTAPQQYAPPVIPPSAPKRPEPEPVYEEEFAEEEVSQEEDDYSEVLTDANLRLEQGSLYKLIMKHELFSDVDADPKAIQNVQRAIRKFAREQMEIMLGMRKETTTVEHLEIDFPFNALEVETLRALARAATKGATDNSDRFVPGVIKSTQEVDNVGGPQRPTKTNTLSSIGSGSKKTSAPSPVTRKPLASKPSAPVKRSKMDDIIEREVRKAGISRELLEEDQLLSKPVAELTPDELMARNELVAKRRGTLVKSSQALPMPSAEQQVQMVEQGVSLSKSNKLIELAMKMPPTKLLNPGE